MPLILCIETATRLCSVAVGSDGALLAKRGLESDKHIHAEKVNLFIDEVMGEAGLALRGLDAVAVGTGPGSYTGLRIGLSAAKGLCFALRIPIIGIGTLETLHAVARAAGALGRVQPMIDARRMEVFTQAFAADARAMDAPHPVVLEETWAEALGACTVVGDGSDKAVALWADMPALHHLPGIRPHAWAMLALAEQRLAEGRVDDLAYLVPDYGKEARVTQPGRKMAP